MEKDKKAWTTETWIQAAGLVAAIIAILVTVFFSARAERNKELSVRILTKRPLLTLDSTSSNSGIEVRLRGASVAAPWLVNIRVENTGDIPIEHKDIESPLSLLFSGGKLISAEVQARSDNSIAAAASAASNSATITHKLLNPTDWISVDLLFDGEPNLPPSLYARISGVSSPRILMPKVAGDPRQSFNPLGVPTPVLAVALALASVLATIFLIGGFAFFYAFFAGLIKMTRRPVDSLGVLGAETSPLRKALQDAKPTAHASRLLIEAMGVRNISELLLDESQQAAKLSEVPANVLLALKLDPKTAASILRRELREALRNSVASQLYQHLPAGKDARASGLMRALDVSNLTPPEILERGRVIFKEYGKNIDSGFDRGELIAGFTFIAFGGALALASLGGWSALLGH